METKGYLKRVFQIVGEARKRINELRNASIDWSEFDGTIIVYGHDGNPVNVEIEGIKNGRLVVNECYIYDVGKTVSLSDVEEMSVCALADYMTAMQKKCSQKQKESIH